MNYQRNWSDTALTRLSKKPNEGQSISPLPLTTSITTTNTMTTSTIPSKIAQSPRNSMPFRPDNPGENVTNHVKNGVIPLLIHDKRASSKTSPSRAPVSSEGPIPLFPPEKPISNNPYLMNNHHQSCELGYFPSFHPMYPTSVTPMEAIYPPPSNLNVMPSAAYVPSQNAINTAVYYDNSGVNYQQTGGNLNNYQGQLSYYDMNQIQQQQQQLPPNSMYHPQDVHSAALRFLQSVLDSRYSQTTAVNVVQNGHMNGVPTVASAPGDLQHQAFSNEENDVCESGVATEISASSAADIQPAVNIRILRRPSRNSEINAANNNFQNASSNSASQNKPAYLKTFEEREADYAAARLRIMGSAYPEETEENETDQSVKVESSGTENKTSEEDKLDTSK